ncbi:Glutathione S-transferase [Bosea sp. 62]|uniref:glutathione S-transferase family protein n=1 Tax=unclassified Bosea (in: a-proteobacteria) TaxID=2653178 RepID=UPI001255BD7A|nr:MULTISPECIES: glutathione S-transferase family protein [unclassified Bosea (in: a-proteobacteria)]CAD5289157.1 Glutathione S-transferase [Bosea sp. 7B]CAD5300316.1 Glutathione S-transferase [Bosea sp. 21B]CAD5300879.1 Glutathione S-transferase [Bosea sp. 46]VVT62017.1 Glutathione S-transferase [Bosea sp. EC-HK365B]VXB50430.1 Glutathione S-transferase [Bosea sp. 125]
MEPILVYGYPSGTSMGLVAALEWLGQPYKLSRVDMLGEMRDPPYKRLNQRVETPVLITDQGHLLTETMAIAAYLEARDEERRISFDPLSPQAERMHQLMGFLNTGFTGAFSPLWAALELPEPDPDFEAALRRFGRERVIERHDRLEEMLDGSRWLAGDKHSLADGLLAGVARWLEYHEIADISRWPKLQALRRRVESDPAVMFATALENGETPAGKGAFKGHVPLAEVIERYGA